MPSWANAGGRAGQPAARASQRPGPNGPPPAGTVRQRGQGLPGRRALLGR